MADEVDYNAVAEMTDGMVGAQLANILDVAALSVLRDGRREVNLVLPILLIIFHWHIILPTKVFSRLSRDMKGLKTLNTMRFVELSTLH
jgi:SpoVK/Ycf46/Vps4 family AAA+-type ATPase